MLSTTSLPAVRRRERSSSYRRIYFIRDKLFLSDASNPFAISARANISRENISCRSWRMEKTSQPVNSSSVEKVFLSEIKFFSFELLCRDDTLIFHFIMAMFLRGLLSV